AVSRDCLYRAEGERARRCRLDPFACLCELALSVRIQRVLDDDLSCGRNRPSRGCNRRIEALLPHNKTDEDLPERADLTRRPGGRDCDRGLPISQHYHRNERVRRPLARRDAVRVPVDGAETAHAIVEYDTRFLRDKSGTERR